MEEVAALIVLATPAPDVLTITVGASLVEDCGADGPHDDAEAEEENGEAGVVDGDFFGASVPAAYVAVEDDDAHEE